MRRFSGIFVLVLMALIFWGGKTPIFSAPPVGRELTYQVYEVAQSRVHTLRIPKQSPYRIRVDWGEELTALSTFASKNQAIAVINGGFFDPKNGQTTSYIRQGGKIVVDPRQNESLMQNPSAKATLPQILNRSEWRSYDCQDGVRYAITIHQAPIPSGCQLTESLGAGPQLLPQLQATEEAFLVYDEQGKVVKDALGWQRVNARSAIGLTSNGDALWVMVEQKPDLQPTGLSLVDLAKFLESLGVSKALNLDGGSSSSLYYQGQFIYGKVDGEGNPVKRRVKSVLWLERL